MKLFFLKKNTELLLLEQSVNLLFIAKFGIFLAGSHSLSIPLFYFNFACLLLGILSPFAFLLTKWKNLEFTT